MPHAGLMYSGHVAAAFYTLAELPKRFIILCPNHTGAGHFAAINREGEWRTPLGDAKIDAALADALMAHVEVLAEDWRAHAREHSLEVQLPFLQQLLGDFTFVPICLGAHRYDYCEEIGNAIADVVAARTRRSASSPAPTSITTKTRRRRCGRTSSRSTRSLELDPQRALARRRRIRRLDVRLHPDDGHADRGEEARRDERAAASSTRRPAT